MYAVIKTGGKQYKVASGDVVKLEKIAGEEGKEVVFNEVLALDDTIGTPLVAGASVKAKVLRATGFPGSLPNSVTSSFYRIRAASHLLGKDTLPAITASYISRTFGPVDRDTSLEVSVCLLTWVSAVGGSVRRSFAVCSCLGHAGEWFGAPYSPF